MKRHLTRAALALTAIAVIVGTAGPAQAIVNGTDDAGAHPAVGLWQADSTDDGTDHNLYPVCGGTLVSPTVVLTAGHCPYLVRTTTSNIDTSRVCIDFSAVYQIPLSKARQTHCGSLHVRPTFVPEGPQGPLVSPERNDTAVIVLDRPVYGITPARLPRVGLLGAMAPQFTDRTFVSVGYGATGVDASGHGIHNTDNRRRAFLAAPRLTDRYLKSTIHTTGPTGGSCFGDSGSGVFIAGTNVLAASVTTGDPTCTTVNIDTRLDNTSVQDFLAGFGVPRGK